MRNMAAQTQNISGLDNRTQNKDGPQNFSELFKTAVDGVNEAQKLSGKLKKGYELGDPNIDLPQVMLAGQKAGIAFKGILEMRNKLLQAYKDVMSMPV